MPSFIGWVPTPQECVEAFFELAPVYENDIVYDLGSGDGRLLIAAAQKGTRRAVGIELDPKRVAEAVEEVNKHGLQSKISFMHQDVLDVDLSPATVVFCYLFPTASEALKPKFESELQTGTRVVMESFSIRGWEPEKTLERGGKWFYLYYMPPKPAVSLLHAG